MTTINKIKNTEIYTILERNNEEYVEKTNLFDFVMESAEELTTCEGVQNKTNKKYNENTGKYEIWFWNCIGNKKNKIEEFDTEEEAEMFLYKDCYFNQFLRDDQRSTIYFETEKEAEALIIERYAYNNNISEQTAKSIFHHKEVAEEIAQKITEKNAENYRIYQTAEKERIYKTALLYANLIKKVDNENFKETAKRLSDAIGSRIESAVFFQAVKIIRQR